MMGGLCACRYLEKQLTENDVFGREVIGKTCQKCYPYMNGIRHGRRLELTLVRKVHNTMIMVDTANKKPSNG